jgi:hypothetical protein
MTNIKQTDLLKYLADKFNNNSFGIPFKMGAYEPYTDENEQVHLYIYAPQNSNENGHFDEQYVFNEETYQSNKKNFVVMSGGIAGGEYTPLPNVQLVSYDITLSFLVFIDNPISEVIRLAIEEVRDSLIGNLDTLQISEVDLTNENGSRITDYLRLATTADSIVFGDINEIMGRRYIEYMLTVTLTVSKNVEMGNQFEWSIAKVEYDESGVEVELTSEDFETVIPLIADFGATQDLESFQTLRSFSTSNNMYKQVHNYVKSRGHAMTFTFMFDSTKPILRELFKESFEVLSTPNIYVINMKFKELNASGVYTYVSDMQKSNIRVVVEECSPSEIVYGEPVVFTIGFGISAK